MTILDRLLEIDGEGKGLTEWEVNFVSQLLDRDVRTFTPKQAEVIRRIHEERVGD